MKLPLLSLLFAAFAFQANAQYAAQQIPANLKARANAIVRDMETTIDMRAPNDVSIRVKKVLTVLNSNGRAHAALVLGYSKNSSIKYIRGQVLNEWGQVKGKFTQADFEDESAVEDGTLFSDSRQKSYLPAEDNYPYTVVYEYEERMRQNLWLPEWVPYPDYDVAVEKSRFTFLSRPDDKIRIKTSNFSGTPEEELTDKQKKLTWTVTGLPAIRREIFGPHPESFRPSVRVAADNFYYHGFTGVYQNWEQLGGWIYENFLKTRRKLSPYTEAVVQDLIKGLPDDKTKAEKLYQYLQQKMRYISVQIGVGGLQPMPAAEVDQMAYGDCKGLVNYMQALLDVAGIESYYCVVNAGTYKRSLLPDFPGVDQANHVILCLPLRGDTTWLECTSQKHPFGFLGDFTDDRTVLACTSGGGKLLRTPRLSMEQNIQYRTAAFQVATDGSMSGKVDTRFGGSEYDIRLYVAQKQAKEQLEALKEHYNLDNIELSNIKFNSISSKRPVFEESFDCRLPAYASGSTNRVYLMVNTFNRQRPLPDLRSRTQPVYLGRGYTDTDSVTYTVPADWKLENKPQNTVIESPFGRYTLTITEKGNQLTYKRVMQMNEGSYPASEYEAFSQFLVKVSTLDDARVVFTRGQVPAGK